MPFPSLALLFSLATATGVPGPVFTPPNLARLSGGPGAMLSLRFGLESGTAPDQVAYRLVDYAGGLVTQGRLHFVKANQWEASLQPAQGYYEVELPASGQRFGVICLPGWKGKPDSFFAIDGGLSWLVSDTALREQLIDQARRSGISMVRDPPTGADESGSRTTNLDGPSRYDSLRQFYRRRDMPFSSWTRRPWLWPATFAVSSRPAGRRGIMGRTGPEVGFRMGWAGGLERAGHRLWRRPAGRSVCGNRQGHQLRTVSSRRAHSVVGGVMAYPNREFLETSAASGLLDRVDAFSFHNYGGGGHASGGRGLSPVACEIRPWRDAALAHRVRPALDARSRPAAHRPGPEKRARHRHEGSGGQGLRVARYFPFVYPFYQENTSNFGMTDRRGTPLRSFACYAQMIRVLAHKHFLGDLRQSPRKSPGPRVFGDDRESVLILYTKNKVTLDAAPSGRPAHQANRGDGRAVRHPQAAGQSRFPRWAVVCLARSSARKRTARWNRA